MNQNNLERLREAFVFKDVEWKIQVTAQDKGRGMAVAYINSRAIQNRLDEVIGAFDWRNTYSMWQNSAQICGLSIYDYDRSEWVTKYDGAENTDIEPVKGGLSDSFKRAASLWGIGRYLYELGGIWVEIEQRGKSSVIKENQYSKLEIEYNKAVAHIFGGVTPQVGITAKPMQSTVSVENQKPSAPATSTELPPENQPAKEPHIQQSPTPQEPIYQIKVVKPSGTASQLLELIDNNGELLTAYVKAGDDAIKPGTRLQNMKIEKRKSEYGEFNVVSAYQVAA